MNNTLCDYKASTSAQVTQHMRTHSGANTKHTGLKPFQCELCEKKFSDKGNLKKHMLSHGQGIKKYQCDLCEHKGSTKQHLAIWGNTVTVSIMMAVGERNTSF